MTVGEETVKEEALMSRARLRLPALVALSEYGIVLSFVTLFATLSVTTPHFLSTTNILNILDEWSAPGIMACAGTFVLIGGGLDLSVGAVYAISGVVAAEVANATSVELGFTAGIACGLVIGIGNGVTATLGRINPIIATLASSFIVQGLALIITGGFIITVGNGSFAALGQGSFLSAKTSVYIFLGFILFTSFLLNRTAFGRYTFAVGGNREAARFAGVPIGLVTASAYALSGAGAGLGGIIAASRVSSGEATSGTGLVLVVVAGIVVGGTSILGGEGAIWRTVLGVLLLAMIGNGLNLLNVNPLYQDVVEGGIILGAVGIDAWARIRS